MCALINEQNVSVQVYNYNYISSNRQHRAQEYNLCSGLIHTWLLRLHMFTFLTNTSCCSLWAQPHHRTPPCRAVPQRWEHSVRQVVPQFNVRLTTDRTKCWLELSWDTVKEDVFPVISSLNVSISSVTQSGLQEDSTEVMCTTSLCYTIRNSKWSSQSCVGCPQCTYRWVAAVEAEGRAGKRTVYISHHLTLSLSREGYVLYLMSLCLQITTELYEADLEKALILSKLEYEQQKQVILHT